MAKRLRRHLQSNIVGYIALLVALGGTAYAAENIGGEDIRNGSIGSGDIRNGSLKGKDVAANTIQGQDVRNNSIQSQDVGEDSIQGRDVSEATLSVVEIKARARGAGAVDVPHSEVQYPLSGNQWTQHSDETDEFFGDISLTPIPGSEFCPMQNLQVNLYANGQKAASGSLSGISGGAQTRTLSFLPAKALFEPDSDTDRTLTATLQTIPGDFTCFSVSALRINVIGYR